MKKFVSFIMAIIVAFAMISCQCTNGNQTTDGTPNVEVVDSMFVEHTVALDRQAMYLNHANDYRWFETGVQLNDWLDGECDGSFNLVVNVFQAVESREDGSFDTFVVKYQHVDGDVYEESVRGFWVEDLPLEEDAINLTYAQAFERVMEVNLPKPHTRQVVLRKPLGPKSCNPQWVFGNIREQIWVDATTGAVATSNPAFDGLNLGTPLGEWP